MCVTVAGPGLDEGAVEEAIEPDERLSIAGIVDDEAAAELGDDRDPVEAKLIAAAIDGLTFVSSPSTTQKPDPQPHHALASALLPQQ
jgi:hypothetical protein